MFLDQWKAGSGASQWVAGLAIGLVWQVGVAAQSSTAQPAEERPPAEQRWLAQQEIQELMRLYAQATDLIAADSSANEAQVESIYRRIFTEDAPIGVRGQMSVSGPSAWLEFVKASSSALRGTQHLIGSQIVEIKSLPNAEGHGGEAAMTSYLHATRVGAGGEISRVVGTYFATVTHAPETGWQLSELTLELLAID